MMLLSDEGASGSVSPVVEEVAGGVVGVREGAGEAGHVTSKRAKVQGGWVAWKDEKAEGEAGATVEEVTGRGGDAGAGAGMEKAAAGAVKAGRKTGGEAGGEELPEEE